MNLTQDLAWVKLLVLLVITLVFLINWYRNRVNIRSYKSVGWRLGLIWLVVFIIVPLALVIMLVPPEWLVGYRTSLTDDLNGWLGVCFVFLLTVVFTVNGIFFSNRLGIRSFPLVVPRLGSPSLTHEEVFAETEGSMMPDHALPDDQIDWRHYWLTIIGVAAVLLAYSTVVWVAAAPEVGDLMRQAKLAGYPAPQLRLTSLFVTLSLVILEEVVFRLGIQNYLGVKLVRYRHGYAIAIVLAAALWTLVHAGTTDNDLIKFMQIFPFGLTWAGYIANTE